MNPPSTEQIQTKPFLGECEFVRLPATKSVPGSDVDLEPESGVSVGEVIRSLRKEKGLSQEELAKKAGVDRTTVARIECGVFKSLSMDKLTGIANAIGIDLKTLLHKTQSELESPASLRSHLDQIAFALEYPLEGFRIVSMMPKRREFFFGRIEIKAQKTILTTKLPHPEQIYLHCLDGKLLLIYESNEFLLKAGDCFVFSGRSDYELYNPEPLKTLSSLFITYPSFLP